MQSDARPWDSIIHSCGGLKIQAQQALDWLRGRRTSDHPAATSIYAYISITVAAAAESLGSYLAASRRYAK